jgi:hypothetical protein
VWGVSSLGLLEAVGARAASRFRSRRAGEHGRCVALKVVLTVPTTVIAAIITTEMSAAMSPYSIAVAPASSRRKDVRKLPSSEGGQERWCGE